MRSFCQVTLALTFLLGSHAFAGDNWPDFRGPAMDGHSDSQELPLQWNEQQNVRWKTAIAGRGWSTPAIWGEQIWLTTATSDGKDLYALCLHKENGEVTRRIKVFEVAKPEPIHDLNSHASPSPVIEAGRVYVHFGTHGTAAINTQTGDVLWKRTDLKSSHSVGPGSSPVLSGKLLILTFDGIDSQYITALDTSTGETEWRTPRSVDLSAIQPESRKAFSTPVVAQVDGKTQVITTAANSASGLADRALSSFRHSPE